MTTTNGGRYGENIEEVAARTMALFYLFDNSGSMFGTKIGQVNYAMKDIPKIIMDIADGAPNAKFEIAAASFSYGATWLTPKPQTPEEFQNTWKDMEADGPTSLGAMLNSLNEKMSRKAFLGDNPCGYLAPGVIILSDGEPTDDWKGPLEKLRKNNWFKNAIKIAFAIGDDANKEVLSEICGSTEAVISIDDPEKIRSYIRLVTATVSKTGTQSNTGTDESAQEKVERQLQEAEDDTPLVVEIPDIDDSQW